MNTVYQTQGTFRLILDAMSKPGKIVTLTNLQDIQGSRHAGLLMISMTLMDHETSYCCLGMHSQTLVEEIYSMTKSRVAEYFMADFMIIIGGTSNNQIAKAKIGTPEYPDENATLIYQVDGFDKSSSSINMKLEGPGINGHKLVSIDGVEKQELSTIRNMNKAYPQGLDCIFLDNDGNVMCLPRSTKITWE